MHMSILNQKESMVKSLTRIKEVMIWEWEQRGLDHLSAYLGTYMTLDPCGNYHHMISPNGITRECEEYWENLEAAAGEVGGWIESGEGDPCDIYFSISIPE